MISARPSTPAQRDRYDRVLAASAILAAGGADLNPEAGSSTPGSASWVRCRGLQTVGMAGGARPLDTGERRVLDPLLVGDFDGAPALREQARGASGCGPLRLRVPVRVPGPEPRCFTCPWPAPRIPSGQAALEHEVGDSTEPGVHLERGYPLNRNGKVAARTSSPVTAHPPSSGRPPTSP